jgi:hypothetical protein
MSFGLAEMGFKGIDLNMGCPVANVAKKGKGSGLNIKPEPLPFFATLATGHPIFKSIPLKPISAKPKLLKWVLKV